MKKEFCCEDMHDSINQLKIVEYDRIDRSYSLPVSERRSKELFFCPWCGSKLPKVLNEEYLEALEKINIVFPNHDFSNVPPEFRTDEWWKKRGL